MCTYRRQLIQNICIKNMNTEERKKTEEEEDYFIRLFTKALFFFFFFLFFFFSFYHPLPVVSIFLVRHSSQSPSRMVAVRRAASVCLMQSTEPPGVWPVFTLLYNTPSFKGIDSNHVSPECSYNERFISSSTARMYEHTHTHTHTHTHN